MEEIPKMPEGLSKKEMEKWIDDTMRKIVQIEKYALRLPAEIWVQCIMLDFEADRTEFIEAFDRYASEEIKIETLKLIAQIIKSMKKREEIEEKIENEKLFGGMEKWFD